ncbi:uncharacterized protein EDB91DRAFT_1055364 [Suillus paluster]|uniref:uncharacterized protein n=1 Tax=Suillus paluster TaxID=48578 RepID=UPI001B8701AD|nr:uncharacterized protein EDB91DRAFT_1055364 [Suillus paluster]KAG1736871.1 hypothetical protein EDB91DRAFT_1055364 [Suillus paluster]
MVNDLTAQVACLKEQVVGLQATVVLQGLYCDRVQQHLETQVKKMEKDNIRLNGNGMPWLLTGNKIFEEVLQHQAQQEAKVAAKKQQCQA